MQIYWLPIIISCLSLILASGQNARKTGHEATFIYLALIFGFTILIFIYQGENSDWRTYRFYVDQCYELECTYFEPGYNLLTFIGAQTLGFEMIKVALVLSYIGAIVVIVKGKAFPLVTIIAVVSISIAALPLMLGAIRQALTLPFLLWAACLLQQQRHRSALLAVVVASTLHYSAAVSALWYSMFWYILARKSAPLALHRVALLALSLIVIAFLFLYLLSNSGLTDTMSLVARIGETGRDTDFITTGGLERDLAIFAERLPFSVAALFLLARHMHSLSKIERIFLLMYISGSAFFFSTFIFDRNIAGRTLATFRLADVLVIVATINGPLSGQQRKPRLPAALISSLIFVVAKSYMTMATVGFFDE